MIKALSLAAALALLPMSAAVADEARGPSEDAIEAAATAFEARMEAFGARAEAISEDASLTEAQRETRIAALWAEYQPDVTAFTAVVTEHASTIAAEALAGIDVEAIVAEALSAVEESGALATAQGIAANGAWASNDPEHMVTYGLMADYAIGSAMDSIEEAQGEVEAAVEEANEAAAEAAKAGPDHDRDD
ncbi:MAG: mucin-associated surface protein (MASP) [bacterium]|nr:MAG: mucin-associated surface protein (MASP) [bacterium]